MPKRRPTKNSEDSTVPKKRQAYHLTCSNCRNKKTRCDGSQPRCKICEAYNEECIYDKAPPMSQITAMADRIKELEEAIQKLHETNLNQDRPAGFTDNEYTSASPEGHTSNDKGIILPRGNLFPSFPTTDSSRPQPQKHTATGDIPFEDATTAALRARSWESMAIKNASIHLGIDSETVSVLLKTHFTWAHPTFLFVYRPAFMRDMAAGGIYFSLLLLSAVLLHSTRFTEKHLNQELQFRVRMLLGQEIHKEPSVVTVQALLQFSAYESGKGAFSQAWLYSGMAFRLAIDLNLFGPSVDVPSDVHNREVRRRLAWSCFLWDKAMSLYLGRVPTLPDPPVEELEITDQSTELELWSPYYGPGRENDQPYVPSPAYTISNFANFCKLGVIINDILANVYGRRRLNDPTFIQRVHERLVAFRAATPAHLKVEPNSLVSPPLHVLSQNLLYHTALILLYRPFRTSDSCRGACRSAARSVEGLLLLLERTFSFSHVTYMMAYCAYTAATIAIEDWKENVPNTESMVNTYLRALQALQGSCPGIQKSIDIIMRNFGDTGKNEYPSNETLPNLGMQMPAFPINDFNFDPMAPTQTMDFDQSSLPFTMLDSFPQFGVSIPDDFFNMATM